MAQNGPVVLAWPKVNINLKGKTQLVRLLVHALSTKYPTGQCNATNRGPSHSSDYEAKSSHSKFERDSRTLFFHYWIN